jgi:hypothetical protein
LPAAHQDCIAGRRHPESSSVKKSRAAKPKARSELASIATRNVIDSRRLFHFFHVARMRSFSTA